MKKLLVLGLLSLAFSNFGFADSNLDDTDAATLSPLTNHYLPDGREVLTTAAKMTVYTFDNDTTSDSTCYGGCAHAWPPVLAAEHPVFGTDIGTSVRRDGSLQLTYKQKPVYLYAGDTNVNDLKGDGLGHIWHIVILE